MTEEWGFWSSLSICKNIVEELGDKIWVKNQDGIGSTFYFTIPKEKV
jgi:signal transduction histidine kinase